MADRTLADEVTFTLSAFNFDGYGCDDFPTVDPIDGGPSEVVRDMAKEVTHTLTSYLRERAEQFATSGADAGRGIAAVLSSMADEIQVPQE